MIISASRRTDIPAFYSEWLIHRLKAGAAFIRHPRNFGRLTRVDLGPEKVDCIVFWTKNPRPMLNRLELLDNMGYTYYFQFTITPYGSAVEKRLPDKTELMDTFKRLSDKIGRKRIVWRYDPVIVSRAFSVEYHLDRFGKMADILADYTERCIFSFIDLYPKVHRKMKEFAECEAGPAEIDRIARGFAGVAKNRGFTLAACAETVELSRYHIHPAACIDQTMIETIAGSPVRAKKDSNQRAACRCIESVDIGTYDCCRHGCVYCYATTSEETARNNMERHDPQSPLLIGYPRGDEVVTARDSASIKIKQRSLF
ncbi:DUF1848 domain-containing protein|uniref:DNA repair photolyase n=1 Tax=Dendrosporobacter quercicolus TaxID=146817 RepID=A0A1G9QT23_9FIRM|nr:DUF1848 domain-containing protein [Dendrosporobacter quercicolus]NSL48352.1 DUF1848 domain-containing protein [Dendrosporobacter quercicolus DSM 1736]SDM14123.1 protein of unknown function [Dendrosporobacter quercicolus]